MTVLELARESSLPPSVVRFYVRSGLLRPHSLVSGGRGFDKADAVRLRLLVELRRLGLPMEMRKAPRHGQPQMGQSGPDAD